MVTLYPLADVIEAIAGISFQGMLIKSKIHTSADQRTATITINASEVKSDNAFFPYTQTIEATDTISSGLRNKGEGLLNWNRTISAKVTLPPRIHKSWAWLIFKKILKERFKNLKQLGKDPAIVGGKVPANQEQQIKNWWLLTKMKIVDHIYQRTVEFQFDYLISTSLETLLSKTCIFSRVNTGYILNANGTITESDNAVNLSDQWIMWQTRAQFSIDGFPGYRSTGPITTAQCLTSSIEPDLRAYNAKVYPTRLAPLEADPDRTEQPPKGSSVTPETSPGSANEKITINEPSSPGDDVSNINSEVSWISYDNQFELIQDNDNIVSRYLQPTSLDYYKSPDVGITRATTGFQINNTTSASSGIYDQPEVINRGIATYRVRMKGYALRVGHGIPIPVVIDVGGQKVQRTGEARIIHKQVAPNDKAPVYLAMWDIEYAVLANVEAENIMATIGSTGHPAHYV
jgi:hypothetical protein